MFNLEIFFIFFISGAAYIMVPPENMTAIEGQRIKFQCGAMAYPSNITYNWFKDNENIKFLPDYGDRINAFKDGSLVITSVIKNDMGWYTCHPTNGIGEDPKASAYLNVTCESFYDVVKWHHIYFLLPPLIHILMFF